MLLKNLKRREDIGLVLNAMGLTGEGVEVGVAFGDNAEQILLWSSLRSLILVDPWDYVPGESPKGHGDMIKDWDSCYLSCIERMKPFDHRAVLLRKDSESASRMFQDGSLDFVYIDANHMSPWIDRDLSVWWPKVKPGGVFGGHDYQDYEIDIFTCNVKSVVDAFFVDAGLDLHIVPGDVSSWYVVKPGTEEIVIPVENKYLSDNSKEVFLNTWPGGYMENWKVYGKMSGKSEEEVVAKCLSPFFDKEKTVLEVGCGKGFWTDRYLAANFRQVIALDLLPSPRFVSSNIQYIEVPDRDFSCFGVGDASVDFCWSFGVFCHMSLEACQDYLTAIFRKLKPGGCASLYFSNNDRRPMPEGHSFAPEAVQWVINDFATTEAMMKKAGFVDIKDLMPDLKDTMIYGRKP